MIKKIAERLTGFIESTDFLKEHKEITREILSFGCEIFLSTIFGWFTVMVLSVCFGRVLEGFIFIVTFSLIRSYSGGYHLSKGIECFLSYIGIFLLTFLVEQIMWESVVPEWLMIFLFPAFCVCSPVSTISNPIPYKKRYQKKCMAIGLVSVLAFVFDNMESFIYQYYGIAAIFWNELLVLIGAFSVKRRKKNV